MTRYAPGQSPLRVELTCIIAEARRRMSAQRVIEVVADWVALGGATRMGLLTATPARGKDDMNPDPQGGASR